MSGRPSRPLHHPPSRLQPRPEAPILRTILLLLLAGSAAAQDVPWTRCSQRLDGQQICGNNSVCTCHYDPGGSLTGRVAGWRWSCDMLQMCGPPAPAGDPAQPLPPGFTYAPAGTRDAMPTPR